MTTQKTRAHLSIELLDDLGYAALSEEDRHSLLDHAHAELEQRVGNVLASRLSDEKLEEFDALTYADESTALRWATNHGIDPTTDPQLQKRLRAAALADSPDPDLVKEWALSRWLALNCPDYGHVVARETARLADDLRVAAPGIVGAMRADQITPTGGEDGN